VTRAALAITVDVDGEAGLPNGGRGHGHRLSARSERAYGLLRGLPRILRALEDFGAPATFYIPGVVAARHGDVVREVLERGHSVGHHGHTHRRPDRLAPAEQRDEIAAGLAALRDLGAPVTGYRAPGWELTPVTLAAIAAAGLHHDSSLMGDDRPYAIPIAGTTLVELPVHWSLDDAPYFASGAGDPRALELVWRRELALAAAGDRPLTLTLHPDILGRPSRLDILRRVLEDAARLGVPAVTHATLAGAL
jgi:peptidoglycan/xylan/chitin deacetylase (PgdA/CDA1 family)